MNLLMYIKDIDLTKINKGYDYTGQEVYSKIIPNLKHIHNLIIKFWPWRSPGSPGVSSGGAP